MRHVQLNSQNKDGLAHAMTIEQKTRLVDTFHKRFSSATIIIENEAGEALIVKASYKQHWTFPGGLVDPGESPLEAAVRETHEEVGIQLNPSDVVFAWVAHRRSRVADSYQFVFRATVPYTGAQLIALQPAEIDEYAFVSKDEVRSGNRNYGEVVTNWVGDMQGYVEQTFGES